MRFTHDLYWGDLGLFKFCYQRQKLAFLRMMDVVMTELQARLLAP